MFSFLVFRLISYRGLGLAHLIDKRWPLAVKAFSVCFPFGLGVHHALSVIMPATLTQPGKKLRSDYICLE